MNRMNIDTESPEYIKRAYMTAQEAATALGYSKSHLLRLVRNEQVIPSYPVANRLYFKPADVERLIVKAKNREFDGEQGNKTGRPKLGDRPLQPSTKIRLDALD